MRKILLAALLLVVGGCQGFDLLAWKNAAHTKAWREACALSEYNCKDVEMPQVVVSNSIFKLNWGLMSALGFFLPGEDNVYIRETVKDMEERYVVLVHEMVHYIIDVNFSRKGEEYGICDNEAKAFEVSDKVAKRLGREDLIRGEDWWVSYPYCQDYGKEEADGDI